MDRTDEKKYTLDEYSWHILNNLQEFNGTPDLISNVVDKIKANLYDHPILSKFIEYYETGLEYYDNHNIFPDIKFFEVNYAKSGLMKRTDDEFSMNVYEDWVKRIDAEIIKKKCAGIIQSVTIAPSDLRNLINVSSEYCEVVEDKPRMNKSRLLNLYDDYAKDYSGVKTGIARLDEKIGVLGHKSISVFGAPSGHGKSTFAITVAYNAALSGLCVDYVSYEVPLDHMWFNIAAIESSTKGLKDVELCASDMKEAGLDDMQREIYREMISDFLKKVDNAGGYLNVIDQTTQSVGTFEEFKVMLNRIATERDGGNDTVYDRKADLIVVDNIDNFQIFKSTERDESVRVNNYIINLDSYCKTYHNGDGCAILLLTQVNRGGLNKLQRAEKEEVASEKSSKVDYTVFQKFNALYEKGTCCLVGFADVGMRNRNKMNIYPVKLRNRGIPDEPIEVYADYKCSRLGGQDVVKPSTTVATQTAQNMVSAVNDNFDVSDLFDEDD